MVQKPVAGIETAGETRIMPVCLLTSPLASEAKKAASSTSLLSQDEQGLGAEKCYVWKGLSAGPQCSGVRSRFLDLPL